jgi:hypothetical protein
MESIYEKDVSKTIVCLNILPHKQCTTNLNKLKHKDSPLNIYSPNVHTPLLNNPGNFNK